MRDDSENKSTNATTPSGRSFWWRVWQLIMAFGHFMLRQISLRTMIMVTLLSLGDSVGGYIFFW